MRRCLWAWVDVLLIVCLFWYSSAQSSSVLCLYSIPDRIPRHGRRLRKGIEIDRRSAQSGASSHLLTAQAAALSTGGEDAGRAMRADSMLCGGLLDAAVLCCMDYYGATHARLSGWMMSLVQPGPRSPKLPRKCGAGKAQSNPDSGDTGMPRCAGPLFTVSGLGSRLGRL